MSLTLRETVERMQQFLNEHPELANCPIYAAEGEDSEFKSQWNEVFVDTPNGHSKTIVSFI